MKSGYRTILVLVITAILLTIALPCRAVEEEEENIWSEDIPQWKHKQHELTEEIIKGMMNHLAVEDPNKAKELEKLKEEDFEKFKTELREAMRQQFGKKIREHREKRSERSMRKYKGFGPGGMPHDMPMHWKHEGYVNWLKENYAEEAEKLAELNEKDPELYWKQLGLSFRKYGRIAEAARENAQLAEVLKEDLALKQQRDELLEEIKTADGDKKEELVKDLEEVIGRRFDLIVKRKQIEYEQLLEKLESLKKEVKQRETKVEKWQDAEFKNESVKARIKELLGDPDEFKWH
jgi:hypothetical protein